MRILHVIAGLDLEGGGSTSAVLALACAQRSLGHDVLILSTDSGDPGSQGHLENLGVDVQLVPARGAWRYSSGLIEWLANRMTAFDVCHVHGLWDFPPIMALASARFARVSSVVSTHGVLSPEALRRSRLKKQTLRRLLVDRMLRHADGLIASGEHEATDLRGLHSRVVVVPHGISTPATVSVKRLTDFGDAPRIGFLGRLHPFKGVDLLVEGTERLRTSWPGLRLQLAGPVDDENHEWVAGATSGRSWVHCLGPVSGAFKWEFLRNLDVLVLPSHFENFGLVVGEALAVGTAVVATSRTAWLEIESRGVGAVCNPDADSVGETLRRVLTNPTIRMNAADQGPRWIQAAFSWPTVARQSFEAYQLLNPYNYSAPHGSVSGERRELECRV